MSDVKRNTIGALFLTFAIWFWHAVIFNEFIWNNVIARLSDLKANLFPPFSFKVYLILFVVLFFILNLFTKPQKKSTS